MSQLVVGVAVTPELEEEIARALAEMGDTRSVLLPRARDELELDYFIEAAQPDVVVCAADYGAPEWPAAATWRRMQAALTRPDVVAVFDGMTERRLRIAERAACIDALDSSVESFPSDLVASLRAVRRLRVGRGFPLDAGAGLRGGVYRLVLPTRRRRVATADLLAGRLAK